MPNVLVAGCGTDVGKSVVSAILTTLLGGDYWKPIECGPEGDTAFISKLVNLSEHTIHPPAYRLQAPLSPHHAARLEKRELLIENVKLPTTPRPLVIEGVGGVLVPFTTKISTLDLFAKWECRWVVVSQHYLGSINHTLLTVEALQRRGRSLAGLIFNGEPNPDSEEAILERTQLPMLGRLLPEKEIDFKTIQHYATLWQSLKHSLLS